MSDTSTTKLIKVYEQRIGRPRFFSSLFSSPPENFHAGEKVEIDIIRQGQQIAIPVRSMDSGPRNMSMDDYVNKALTPTVFNYDVNISASNLITREPGVDPYTDPNWATAATSRVFRVMRKLEDMFRDGIELMASQVMTTGQLALIDDANNSVFAVDFQPLDTTGTLVSGDLIVTASTLWSAAGYDPLTDLGTLARNMAARGYNATDVVFGSTALTYFLGHSGVQTQLNLLKLNIGSINQVGAPDGAAQPVGEMVIGNRVMRLWVYDATYKHPYTGVITPYMPAAKVTMYDRTAPRDLTWGEIPLLPAPPGQQQLSFIPQRLSFGQQGIDFQVTAYVTQDRKNLVINCGCRPLTIPTAIDALACITVA